MRVPAAVRWARPKRHFSLPLPLSPVPRLLRWSGVLALVFLAVMSFWRLGTYLAFSGRQLSVGQALPAFWLGLRFDARVVAVVLLPLLTFGGIRALNPWESRVGRRLWLTLLGAFAVALVLIYTADYLHFHYLGQRLNASVLSFLHDAEISAGMAWQSYPILRIAAAIVMVSLALVALLTFTLRSVSATAVAPRRRASAIWHTVAILAGAFAAFGRVGQYPLRWSDAFDLRSAAGASLALNPVESLVSSLNFRTATFDAGAVRAHYPRMAGYLGVRAPDADRLMFARETTAGSRTTPVAPNVVLVLCESFSAYKSSLWGNPLDPTPFFSRLARAGVLFDNCFTPHFGTARGVWATITGIPDVSLVETASRNPAMVDQHTLIDDFTGYEKFYFLGGSSSWANIRGLLTNNITNLRLYEEDSYDAPRIDVWGISDKNLLLEADKVLRTQTRPFFAVIQTADNHRPYTIPEEDRDEFKLADVPPGDLQAAGYESLAELNAFRYADFALEKFMTAAKASPYFDNTLFVFIGDHGIGGDAGGMFPPAWTEQHLTRYHVPLLFYAPKLLPARRIHSVASMVDVLPTIAGLAQISYRNNALGRDLLRQEQLDGGASNVAFIIDHNDRTVGVVRQQRYGREQAGGRHEVVWADFAMPAPAAPLAPADREEFRTVAQAFYETARYLLLNNQKVAAPRAVHTTTALTP